MDPTTYYDSIAAKNLANILENQSKTIKNKTSRFLHLHFTYMNDLKKFNLKHKHHYLLRTVEDSIYNIIKSPLPIIVKTHACNIIKGHWKEYLRNKKL